MVEETRTTRALEGNLGDEGDMTRGTGREEGFPEEGVSATEEWIRIHGGLPVNQDEGHTAPAEGEGAIGKAEAGGVSLAPEHSSSRAFCESHGEECRDDVAGCHRSQ